MLRITVYKYNLAKILSIATLGRAPNTRRPTFLTHLLPKQLTWHTMQHASERPGQTAWSFANCGFEPQSSFQTVDSGKLSYTSTPDGRELLPYVSKYMRSRQNHPTMTLYICQRMHRRLPSMAPDAMCLRTE